MVTVENFNVISIIMLLGGFTAVLLSSVLVFRLHKNPANLYIGLFLGTVGLTLIHQFLVESNYIKHVPLLIGWILPFEFIFPPTLYLYIQTMTVNPTTRVRQLLHFIPALLGVILLVPFYSLDFELKLNILRHNFEQSLLPGMFHDTFPIFVTATSVQFIIYLFFYFSLLKSHSQNVNTVFSYRSSIALTWLRNFLIALISLWLVILFFYSLFYQQEYPLVLDRWIYIFSTIAIVYIGIMAVLQNRIYSKKQFTELQSIININLIKNNSTYISSAISTSITKDLDVFMTMNKPYLDNNLSLFDLAKAMNVPPGILSVIIKQQSLSNFIDYINAYRIKAILKKIKSDTSNKNMHFKFANQYGFKSYHSFKLAFKKYSGQTLNQ